MRTIPRPIVRCPEPHCAGQLLVQEQVGERGHGVESYLACSFCGREPKRLAGAERSIMPSDAGAALVPVLRTELVRACGRHAPVRELWPHDRASSK